jgi:hypothetical protein
MATGTRGKPGTLARAVAVNLAAYCRERPVTPGRDRTDKKGR